MYNCSKVIPAYRRLSGMALVPARTFFSRRALVPRDMFEHFDEVDRRFARMEREMHDALQHITFPIPRIRSVFEPPAVFSPGRRFPAFEAETIPSEEVGKPGKYTVRVNLGKEVNPDDIKITLKDRLIKVQAKFEHKYDDGRIYQEFSKSFTLPENLKQDELKTILNTDGILTIEAELPQVEANKPTEIPVTVESSKPQ